MKKLSRNKLAAALDEAVSSALNVYGPAGHPARILLDIANDPTSPKTLKILACEKLLPYIASRLSKVELDGQQPLVGATFVDTVQVIAQIYSAKNDPGKRAQLLAALNAPPAPEAPEDDQGA